jgi:DNA invertase Pin-like site-specific DNA recombinase
MTKQPAAVAYSYARFSHPSQGTGDSLRRQAELRDAWLKKAGVTLDTSLSLEDRGVSAFTGEHRSNPDRHALASFLELVRQGRIARGSFLIVENLDRLSREDIRPALTLLLNLIDRGVKVVQLLPVEAVFDESVEPMQLMMAIMELSRGNSESRMKSERVGRAWAEKKRRAAEHGEPVTAQGPSWLRLVGGRWQVVGDAADTVRAIFRLVIEGHGLRTIAKRLNAEGVPPIGRSKHWFQSYLAKIVGNRAVVGEYQPHAGRGGGRRPDGGPVPNYYPAVISEEEWSAAQAALACRRTKPGRLGKGAINLFAGLLHSARDGGTMHRLNRGKPRGQPVLVPYRGRQGLGRCVSFPARVLERAVLSCLREIDPREVLPWKDRGGDRVLTLSGRLQEVQDRSERIKQKLLESPDVDALVDVLRTLEEKHKALAEELAEARREAASPPMEAWGQCRTLIDALDRAPDQGEARVRLRAALRRIVDGVWVLAVGRGRDRLAAAQLWFADGKHQRSFLILHRPARANGVSRTEGSWTVRSFKDVAGAGSLDLRRRDHAARLEKVLSGLPLEKF